MDPKEQTTLLGWKHMALECLDLPRALKFYRETFGMQTYLDGDADWAMLSLGDTYLSLVPVKALSAKNAAPGSHPGHLGMVVASAAEVRRLHDRLRAEGVSPLGKLTPHRDGSLGFYLADPDGNALECIFIPHHSHSKPLRNQLWVLLAHGSPDPAWAQPFAAVVESLKGHLPSVGCELAFMEFQKPTLEDILAVKARPGLDVSVFPLFFSGGGGHMRKDVPALVAAAAAKFPDVSLRLHAAIGESALVQQAVVAAIVRQAQF